VAAIRVAATAEVMVVGIGGALMAAVWVVAAEVGELVASVAEVARVAAMVETMARAALMVEMVAMEAKREWETAVEEKRVASKSSIPLRSQIHHYTTLSGRRSPQRFAGLFPLNISSS